MNMLVNRSYGLLDVVFIGYVVFIIALALQYRDFSTMKAIYIYPALLSFLVLFLDVLIFFDDLMLKQRQTMTTFFEIAVVFLIGLYVTDICQMVIHLYNLNLK